MIKYVPLVMSVLVILGSFPSAGNAESGDVREVHSQSDEDQRQAREFLEGILCSRQEIDDWLADRAFPFGKYDPDVGFLHRPRREKHGVDGSHAIYTYGENDARRMFMHAGRPCRINTYGDSFTSCEQVSDGETWQEALAAHLREPVRNYGIGGYSVYQAYLRMKREETVTPAKVIILNIYEADHRRNLLSWQKIFWRKSEKTFLPTLPYVRANPSTGEFVECSNPCPTPESLYNLCDPEWVYETFKDDFWLQIELARDNLRTGSPEESYGPMTELAARHGFDRTIDTPRALGRAINELPQKVGLYATMRTVDLVEEFARANDKKVLYVLSYGKASRGGTLGEESLTTGNRFDQELVDYLKEARLPFVDMLEAHAGDFAQYKIDAESYLDQYYVGHYNPRGNFFFAFALKEALVGMMDPKPAPYRFD